MCPSNQPRSARTTIVSCRQPHRLKVKARGVRGRQDRHGPYHGEDTEPNPKLTGTQATLPPIGSQGSIPWARDWGG
jgi:hypothetical protein